MSVTIDDLRAAVRGLGLSGRALCVHASLRSFGRVDGGASKIVEGSLAERCTVLVPSFTSVFAVPPPAGRRPARNGLDYDRSGGHSARSEGIYTPATVEIDAGLGAIPSAVVGWSGRARGNHPLNSFSAVGSQADELISGQSPTDVYAPLRALARAGGSVVLMGVALNRMTLIHLAEQVAGRRLFRRWANGPDLKPMEVETGGCSDGFVKLGPLLAPLMREINVGASTWRVFLAGGVLDTAARAIRNDPRLTHCDRAGCARCNDAARGGPLVAPIGGM